MLRTKNNIFQNWSKDFYIANKIGVTYDDYNNEIIEYAEPVYIGKVNYQPLNSKLLEAYMKEYGEHGKGVIGALLDYIDVDKMKRFDLAYLYGATPEGELEYGQNANYIIKAFKPQNTKIMVLLEEVIKEETNE